MKEKRKNDNSYKVKEAVNQKNKQMYLWTPLYKLYSDSQKTVTIIKDG